MAKKKSKNRLDIWDFLMLAFIVAGGWYILAKEGAVGLMDTIIRSVFLALIVGIIIRFATRRAGW